MERATKPLVREVWRSGRVAGFRRREDGPWDLLFRALGALISDRNPGVEFDANVRGDKFGQAPRADE